MISANRKRVRIQAGRAFAVDPWLHLFVLKIEPMMVVIGDSSPACATDSVRSARVAITLR